MRFLTVWIGCVFFTGCWTPQRGDGDWQDYALAQSREAADEDFAAPASLWQGTVEREDTDNASPQAGDVVVYSIDIETPASRVRRYLRLSVGPITDEDSPIEVEFSRSVTFSMSLEKTGETREIKRWSSVLPVTIEIFDESGEQVSSSRVDDAFADFLAVGFFAAARERTRLDASPEDVDQEEVLRVGMLDAPPMFSIAALLNDDETLRDLAFELIDTSLLWTVIWSFGASFLIAPDHAHAERIDREAATGQPGYTIPVQFRFNDRSALRIAVTVVEPRAPLGISAGVTRVDGFRSTDDRYRFRVRYLPRP